MSEEKYQYRAFVEANPDGSDPCVVFYLNDDVYHRIRIPLSGALVEIPNGEVDSRGFYKYKLDNLTTIEHIAKEKGLL